MANILEDTINFGFGLFAYSREKIEELVEKLVQKGDLAKTDAASFVSELVQKGDAERKELKNIVGEEVKKAIDRIKPVTKEDIRQIIREEMNTVKNQSDKK